jgi:hypothetical protein
LLRWVSATAIQISAPKKAAIMIAIHQKFPPPMP